MSTSSFEWPSGKRAAALFTVDLDAESGILYTHPETASQLDVLAHQAYDVRTGVYRLLRIFAAKGVRGTFYIPGFTARRWPDVVRDIKNDGHEIGHHGYLHEYLAGADQAHEEDILLRGMEAIVEATGERPLGYRAPGFKLNLWSPALLKKHGFIYDSSLQDMDVPYRLATGEGPEADSIIELPVQWALDDFAYYMHLPRIRPGFGIEGPEKVFEIWSAELEALIGEGGCFNLTLHPMLSGRASRAAIVERMIDLAQADPSVWITSSLDVARHAEEVATTKIWNRPVPESELRYASNGPA